MTGWPELRRIVAAAAVAGLLAGLAMTALQHVYITPLIRQAEAHEGRGHHAPPAILATTAANVVLATGFALLLASGLSLRRASGWRAGMLWGLAGYAVFFVAPALQLPPQLPGSDSPDIDVRTLWWIGTVVFSAAGLGLAAFAREPSLRVVGIVLVLIPQIAGATQAPAPTAELARDFVRAAYLLNAAFWLLLGALLGLFYKAEPAR